VTQPSLLGPAEIRRLATAAGLRPTKSRGQNFVHDANTVRRIVRASGVSGGDVVVEVGPGLGSLTLALLPVVAHVHAIEIDPVLAALLPRTVATHAAGWEARLSVRQRDAMGIIDADLDPSPSAMVANLPYNVAVPVLLHLLAELPGLRRGLVMVQQEVAERLTAAPGSRVYGSPTAKLAWYADARLAGRVSPAVFWPVPRVESGLVAFERRQPPSVPAGAGAPDRQAVFAVVDAAFAQRRKMLRSALAAWAGGTEAVAQILAEAGVPGTARGEELDITAFVAIATARTSVRPYR
jgi:16S rRNA (adenine1518-N6/adenine1519-N6)-dimethyltransferase